MGILKRIKNRLPIVGGNDARTARPASAHKPSYTPEPKRTPQPPPPPPKTAEEVHAEIQADIDAHTIVLFMKGSANAPQCGFSAAAVDALRQLDVPFETRNVVADPMVRQGIKDFSDWPTIPQLYIAGEFIGGSDIVREMLASGELKEATDAALGGE
ncbi:MAG: Grx4 family monothiol glutaredoxin [Proteobacteria bacterium]|nr:Grx4 family monothiol glutaredoxin [Pseudomonadota bacterium]